jgi:Ca2+-binding RTX toxin-like protein
LGSDFIDGGAGTDTARFSGALGDYQVTQLPGATRVQSLQGGGTVVLVDVEKLAFSDQTMSVSSRPFDPLEYIASYADLIAAFHNNPQSTWADSGRNHFITNGAAEGRYVSFDGLQYIAANPDLIQANFGADRDAGARHYIANGFSEGRSTTFDGLRYIASYADLIGPYGANLDAGAAHYIQFGFQEGRGIYFDPTAYLAGNPDLQPIYGSNLTAATIEYIQEGYAQGRKWNFVVGTAGNDSFSGNLTKDGFAGGAGDDTYFIDTPSMLVVEKPGEGNDTVWASISYTLPAYVEILAPAGSGFVTGTGNALDNYLFGNSNDNTLNGLGGVDHMFGATGNDSYVVDNAADQVVENPGEGNDTVFASVSYTLSDNVETLSLTAGAGAINATGNGANNTLIGNESANVLSGGGGDDTLIGGLGADTMIGGLGNDTYEVDNAGDQVIENGGEGIDGVWTRVNYILPDNVETLALIPDAGAINATGNSANNTLIGNASNNVLNGGGGNDTIDGGAGFDTGVFTGNQSDYTITNNAGILTVVDHVGGRDGTDTLSNVELLQFADGIYDYRPDLSGWVYAIGGGPFYAGQTITITLDSINGGFGPAPTSHTGIYLSTDTAINGFDTYLGQVDVPGLTPYPATGYYAHQTVSVTLPSNLGPGTYYIGAFADYLGQVTEVTEGNQVINTTSITIAQPDLSVSSASIYHGHTYLLAGQYFNFGATIANSGSVLGGGHYDEYVIDPPSGTGGWGFIAAPGVGASGSYSWNTNLHIDTAGSHSIVAIADANGNMVPEINEGNNSSAPIGLNVVAHGTVDGNGFDASYYLANNPDLVAAGYNTSNAWSHYANIGWHEGRNPNAWFDTNYYLSHNGDVAAAGVNPLLHYINGGDFELRDAGPNFHTIDYYNARPDVWNAHLDAMIHAYNHLNEGTVF